MKTCKKKRQIVKNKNKMNDQGKQNILILFGKKYRQQNCLRYVPPYIKKNKQNCEFNVPYIA